MVLSFLIAAFLTPSDIWCQIVACLFIYLIIELTTFYALIIRVYKKQLSLFKPKLRYGRKKPIIVILHIITNNKISTNIH
jgi:Sec-independent protein secretion pathway component TatC